MVDDFYAFLKNQNRSDGYSFLNCGNCLGDLVPDKSLLEVKADLEIEIGNIVTVVVKQEGPFRPLDRWLGMEGMLGVTKIFLGKEEAYDGEEIFLFGQIHPPLIAPIPRSAIEAMHLVTGGITGAEMGEEMAEDDRAGMQLLGPFFRHCETQKPINPEWRPPEREDI